MIPTRRGLAAGAALLPTSFIGPARADTSQGTFERVSRNKRLRMAVVSGGARYFKRDFATGAWAGAVRSQRY